MRNREVPAVHFSFFIFHCRSVSVSVPQHPPDALLVALEQFGAVAQVALCAGALLAHQVVHLGTAPHEFTGSGDLESLRGRLAGLQFNLHISSLFVSADRRSAVKTGRTLIGARLTAGARSHFGSTPGIPYLMYRLI